MIPKRQQGPCILNLGVIRTCSGCEYHNQIGVMFGQTRNEYEHYCEPESMRKPHLTERGKYARFIAESAGEPVKMPEWCPLKGKNNV